MTIARTESPTRPSGKCSSRVLVLFVSGRDARSRNEIVTSLDRNLIDRPRQILVQFGDPYNVLSIPVALRLYAISPRDYDFRFDLLAQVMPTMRLLQEGSH